MPVTDHAEKRPLEYIDTTDAFIAYRRSLSQREIDTVAIDIEGEFNLHIYGEHFCLLQLFDGERAIIVDPLTVSRDELQAFLEDRDLIKIAYDAASDRSLLYKTKKILLRGILDLRPAVELLGFEKRGLSNVLGEVLGVRNDANKKRYQQYNWTKRPIDDGALNYAIEDVLHLFRLRDALLPRIVETGLLPAYIRENLKVQDVVPQTDREPGVLRSKAFRRMSKPQQRSFRALFTVRERYAAQLNLPPNTVLPNRTLFAVAQGERSTAELPCPSRVPGDTFTEMVEEMMTVDNRG